MSDSSKHEFADVAGGLEQSAAKEQQDYGFEDELKYITDAGTIRHILSVITAADPFVGQPIERDERTNTYFDTPKKFQLYRRGIEVRGRAHDSRKGKFKYDLKCAQDIDSKFHGLDESGIFRRREYRKVSKRTAPKLEWFAAGDMTAVLEPIENKTLVPWVHGDFKRSRLTFSPPGYPDAKVEIAFEVGRYRTHDGQHSSKEMHIIELELKQGPEEALLSLHKALQDKYDLKPCFKTKGEMGMEFVGNTLTNGAAKRFQAAHDERRPPHYPDIPHSEFWPDTRPPKSDRPQLPLPK